MDTVNQFLEILKDSMLDTWIEPPTDEELTAWLTGAVLTPANKILSMRPGEQLTPVFIAVKSDGVGSNGASRIVGFDPSLMNTGESKRLAIQQLRDEFAKEPYSAVFGVFESWSVESLTSGTEKEFLDWLKEVPGRSTKDHPEAIEVVCIAGEVCGRCYVGTWPIRRDPATAIASIDIEDTKRLEGFLKSRTTQNRFEGLLPYNYLELVYKRVQKQLGVEVMI